MKTDEELFEELRRSYCTFCNGDELEITKIIQIKCKKCGKTRVIQRKEITKTKR
ncbi:MAG: hypothetical protein WC492_03625 [Candidatus Micrarchaeia archaeon]